MTCRRGSCWKERERSKRCRVPVADQGGKMLQFPGQACTSHRIWAPSCRCKHAKLMCAFFLTSMQCMQHLPSHNHLLHVLQAQQLRNNIMCQHHVEHLLGILCSHIWHTYQQCYTSKSIRIVTSVHNLLLMNTPAFFKHMHLANPWRWRSLHLLTQVQILSALAPCIPNVSKLMVLQSNRRNTDIPVAHSPSIP